ncbi:biotin--[acetyl-CoA-carboxylase] ligase [Sediminitomix flava]|uniref:BirA family biotin operon repressor/biotin-[acetyl-CoA-carboxylase] ligase n=1 Tax=Sediminitomix flava TaxID=379075 RepID=A0A315ZFT2_SEDFL|nr:biotin--[acetyl-CoA-carboxylase] ligase [Sediminitomix flava]PWJ44446.1 BirA family biotin operon repressor/biotin-[acetyl-CoA-carboxylase] ligase [Sediminitomix flava]
MYKNFTNTYFIGKKVTYLPTCHSTNDIASEIIQKGEAIDGQCVITSYQTKGRGQRGNYWESEEDKNIMLSLILRPSFLTAYEQFQLNIAISLGIFDVLYNYTGDGLTLKWPNDIYFKKQKLCGILIENCIKGSKIDTTTIGMGININQCNFNHPEAISVSQITGKLFNLEEVIADLLKGIEKRYFQLLNGKKDLLKQDYLSKLLNYQVFAQYLDMRKDPPEPFEGNILGVNDKGQLAVQRTNEIDYFNFKEVKFVINR